MNCVDTVLFGNVCGSEGIARILELVVTMMSIGVGILGVIGISIAGIQYLTAGGNEEKTKKAKRRIYEVSLGLIAYVVMFSLIGWLNGGDSAETSLANISSAVPESSDNDKITKNGAIKKVGNKVYIEGKNGKKLKGRQRINDAYYYLDKKTGALVTGFVTEKKNGETSYYYYSPKDGKQVFGVAKFKGPYNGTKNDDTWYFNKKTGKLEGVQLAVPRIHQTDGNCGPTSQLEIRGYYVGTKGFTFSGRTYPWNKEDVWANICGRYGESFWKCSDNFGAKYVGKGMHTQKGTLLNELFHGRPFIFSVGSCGQRGAGGIDPCSTRPVFTSCCGHFMTVSGYYKDKVFLKDPAGSPPRQTVTSWTTFHGVANGYYFFIPWKKLR